MIPSQVEIFGVSVHFYGAMYALAAVVGYFLTAKIAKFKKSKITTDQISDAIFWAMMGGILGGRIFYVLVYNFDFFWANPWEIPKVWHGGMSIHGGLLGGVFALFLWSKKAKKHFWELTDLFAPALALGLAFGRFGNFVNGELVGRPTDFFLGMDFGDGTNRHPSQLYAVFKDLFLCGILLFLSLRIKKMPIGKITAFFFLLYGFFRFFVEFFREPDAQIGLLFGFFSLGQMLSLGVFTMGLFLFFHFHKRKDGKIF